MSTEKRKIHRVIDAAGTLVQVLPETSAEQVTLADTAGNFTSNNVEGALAEIAGIASTSGVTGVKGDAESAYRKGNVNITKANIGLGNVDNTADANKSVKYATEAGKATNDSAGNKIADTYATKTELRDGLAGKATTKTYENYQAFVTAIGLLSKLELKVGDNIYIKKLDVPDMWVTAVNATSVSYTYTNDQAIINALDTTSGLTVGYFSFSKLETEKVDLTTYQTKTDNTLATTSKTVVGAINEVRATAESVKSTANANETDISNIKNGTIVVKEADHANTATTANSAQSVEKLSRSLKFKTLTGLHSTAAGVLTTTFDGQTSTQISFDINDFASTKDDNYSTTNHTLTLSLRDDIVTAGQYSAVNVDAKGRVTAGGKSIEWGTSGQTTPSGDLMTGGLFMELQ